MRPRKKDRHLPKCVYRRRGAYYLVTRGKWERLGTDLAGALAEYARRHNPTAENALDKLIDSAFEQIKRRPTRNGKPIAESTKDQYADAVKAIKKMLRQFSDPRQVKPKDIARMKALLADKPNMANRILSVTRQLFDVWLEQQLVEGNPAVGIRRHPEARRTRLVSPEEFVTLYDKSPPRLQAMLDLWRLTGQRVMDVVRIRRADIREDGLYFRQEKTGAELIVKWSPELRQAVDRAKTLYGNVRALTLFHSRKGTPPSYRVIHDQWRRVFKASGLEGLQLRDLRATAITAAKRQGMNPTALAGHKNASMTERYLRDREVPVVEGPSFGQVLDIGREGSGNQ